MTNNQVKILGRYVPSQLEQGIITLEIKRFLPDCLASETIGIRYPQGDVPHPDNLKWHQDGHGPDGNIKHMVVWASEDPTELRDSEGMIRTAEPFDVVWFDNHLVFHKQPENTRTFNRWFLAVRCRCLKG